MVSDQEGILELRLNENSDMLLKKSGVYIYHILVHLVLFTMMY